MIPDFIPSSLVKFWIFVTVLSFLPLVCAIVSEYMIKKNKKRGDNK